MRKFFIFCAILLSSSAFCQNKVNLPKDTLAWKPGERLSTKDFMGKPSGKAAGMASTGIFLTSRQENGVIVVVVEAVFLKSKSFLKTNSEYSLKHEQGHFDICELFARQLRQKISQKNFRKVKNINAEMKKLYKQVMKAYEKEQSRYDKETNHSINTARQQSWNEKIETSLKETEAFKSSEIKLLY